MILIFIIAGVIRVAVGLSHSGLFVALVLVKAIVAGALEVLDTTGAQQNEYPEK